MTAPVAAETRRTRAAERRIARYETDIATMRRAQDRVGRTSSFLQTAMVHAGEAAAARVADALLPLIADHAIQLLRGDS